MAAIASHRRQPQIPELPPGLPGLASVATLGARAQPNAASAPPPDTRNPSNPPRRARTPVPRRSRHHLPHGPHSRARCRRARRAHRPPGAIAESRCAGRRARGAACVCARAAPPELPQRTRHLFAVVCSLAPSDLPSHRRCCRRRSRGPHRAAPSRRWRCSLSLSLSLRGAWWLSRGREGLSGCASYVVRGAAGRKEVEGGVLAPRHEACRRRAAGGSRRGGSGLTLR